MSVHRRYPAVAGTFYEATREKLMNRIKWCFTHSIGPGKLPEVSTIRRRESVGFVVPHAGYMYSGPVAAHAYYRIAVEGRPDVFIIVGPNHTGIGTAASVYDRGVWLTPLGEVKINSELAVELIRNSSYLDVNYAAHIYEHSIEVQLPFLQHLFDDFTFVPIVMSYQVPEVAKDLANAIVNTSRKLGKDVVVLASSDLTHYEPHEVAYAKDTEVLRAITNLRPEDVYNIVTTKDVSMCGVGPVLTLLYVAILSGGKSGEVLKYATSGDITGDLEAVVGYASVRIY